MLVAVRENQIACVRALFHNGGKKSIKWKQCTPEGLDALLLAGMLPSSSVHPLIAFALYMFPLVDLGFPDIVRCLLEKGYSVDTFEEETSQTALIRYHSLLAFVD